MVTFVVPWTKDIVLPEYPGEGAGVGEEFAKSHRSGNAAIPASQAQL